jgi:TonB family protein
MNGVERWLLGGGTMIRMRSLKRGRATFVWSALWFAVVSGGICQSPGAQISPKRIVAMEYPLLARVARVEGRVEVVGTVSSEGAVTQVRVLSGHALLAFGAKETLLRWRFAGCDDKERGCEVRITFTFKLSGTCVSQSSCRTEFAVDLPDAVEVKSGHVGMIID